MTSKELNLPWSWRRKVAYRFGSLALILTTAFWFFFWLFGNTVPDSVTLQFNENVSYSLSRWWDVFFAFPFGCLIGLMWTERARWNHFMFFGCAIAAVTGWSTFFWTGGDIIAAISFAATQTVIVTGLLSVCCLLGTDNKLDLAKTPESKDDFSNAFNFGLVVFLCSIALPFLLYTFVLRESITSGRTTGLIITNLAITMIAYTIWVSARDPLWVNRRSAFTYISGAAFGLSTVVCVGVGFGAGLIAFGCMLLVAMYTVGLRAGINDIFSRNTWKWLIAEEEREVPVK